MRFKFYLLLFIILPFVFVAVAQTDSNKIRGNAKPVQKTVPNRTVRKDSPVKKPVVVKTVKDSLVKKRPAITKLPVKDSVGTSRPDSVKKAVLIADSLHKYAVDSIKQDSLKRIAGIRKKVIHTWQNDTTFNKIFDVPYLPVKAKPLVRIDAIREADSKDLLFYVLTGMLFFLGFIRLFFPKYFTNVFRMFFQTSFRQKQTREQLVQDRLPSLLMNIFFAMVGGVFIALAAERNNWFKMVDFWLVLLYCSGLLVGIYMIKYLVLQFTGWVFNARESANTYSFIVFLINKMLAIALLPLLLLYAFSSEEINKVLITIITCMVVFMFGYRYIVSLSTIRGNLKVNAIHFFIYLCAVEIVPMIIIYKVLFNFVSKSI